ncbi:MAG: SBBP repeat-containing protein [Candidatus Hodarchaeota archaeon]
MKNRFNILPVIILFSLFLILANTNHVLEFLIVHHSPEGAPPDDMNILHLNKDPTLSKYTNQESKIYIFDCEGIETDSDGNIYTVGHSHFKSRLIKWNSTGYQQWNRSTEGVHCDIAVDDSGNIFLHGTSAGYYRLEVLFADGNHWSKKLSMGDSYYGRGVTVDSNGSIYTVGYKKYTKEFFFNTVLIKWDADGNHLWTRTLINYSYPTHTFGLGITVDSDGSVYTVGYKANGISLILIKWDADGNQIWERNLPIIIGIDIKIDCNGFIYTWTINEDSYVLLVKWDNNGNQLWNRTCGNVNSFIFPPEDYGGISFDTEGNIYGIVTSIVAKLDPGAIDPIYYYYIVFGKWDAMGTPIGFQYWDRDLWYGDKGQAFANELVLGSNGNIYCAIETFEPFLDPIVIPANFSLADFPTFETSSPMTTPDLGMPLLVLTVCLVAFYRVKRRKIHRK